MYSSSSSDLSDSLSDLDDLPPATEGQGQAEVSGGHDSGKELYSPSRPSSNHSHYSSYSDKSRSRYSTLIITN